MNFRSRKWTVLLLILLIILSFGVFIKFSLGFQTFDQNLTGLFLNSFSKNPFAKQSEVQVSLTDLKLNFNFELIEEDKPKFKSFVRNWFGPEFSGKYGVGADEEIETLSFGIDDNLAGRLSSNLPVALNLKITDKSLEFNSRMVSGLEDPLVKNGIQFATGSSRLNGQFTDPSKFQIKIDNPADLANYATASGKLTVSPKIEGLFKTLPKIATIELNVNGKNVSGRIVLK